MHGLLARLKGAQEGGGTTLETILSNGGDERGLPTRPPVVVNNFISSDGVTADDGYVTRTLDRALSVDSATSTPYHHYTGPEQPTRTEDVLAIETVMASNKARPSRDRRINSSTSSYKTVGRNSKTRGSRISLNSVTLSERDDAETSGMESDDETLNTSRSQVLTSAQLWAQFENAVKNIDNGDPDVFIKKPKPNFVSSEAFQKVMVDMYGNTEYGNTKGYTLLKQKLGNMARSTTLASRMLSSAMAKGQEDREREEEERERRELERSLAGYLDTPSDAPDEATKSSAKRGWKIMKRQVNEQVMEQKTQSTKVNWHMISHTVKQMSNMEKARQDLYERYGILPTVQEDGSVICENRMLSERARRQLNGAGGQENKRPLSYQPPPTYLRSKSRTTLHGGYGGGNVRGNNLTSKKLVKRRPMTAKSMY